MLERIHERRSTLSPAERRVADWVVAHPLRASRMTLAELAAACGSSEPTVIRFCRRFGLKGFRELAPRLTEALSRPVSYIHHDVAADDLPGDAARKVVDASIQSLFRLRADLSAMPIAPRSTPCPVPDSWCSRDLGRPGTWRAMPVTSSSGSAFPARR